MNYSKRRKTIHSTPRPIANFQLYIYSINRKNTAGRAAKSAPRFCSSLGLSHFGPLLFFPFGLLGPIVSHGRHKQPACAKCNCSKYLFDTLSLHAEKQNITIYLVGLGEQSSRAVAENRTNMKYKLPRTKWVIQKHIHRHTAGIYMWDVCVCVKRPFFR